MLQIALNCQTEVQNWIEKEIGKEAVVGSFFLPLLDAKKNGIIGLSLKEFYIKFQDYLSGD